MPLNNRHMCRAIIQTLATAFEHYQMSGLAKERKQNARGIKTEIRKEGRKEDEKWQRIAKKFNFTRLWIFQEEEFSAL